MKAILEERELGVYIYLLVMILVVQGTEIVYRGQIVMVSSIDIVSCDIKSKSIKLGYPFSVVPLPYLFKARLIFNKLISLTVKLYNQ